MTNTKYTEIYLIHYAKKAKKCTINLILPLMQITPKKLGSKSTIS